jgi:hypothetical protein
MRPNCPICGLAPIDTIEMDYAIPDGWTLPTHYNWRLCNCGFIWADTSATPEDFDEYYRKHYSPHIDAHDIHRQRQLAAFIFERIQKNARIVDFGGGDSIIVKQLQEYRFENVSTVNLDDDMPEYCEVVIMSQVIEHLYDLKRDIGRIDDKLDTGCVIIVETPDAYRFAQRNTPPMLDYYPTHVNHFQEQTLTALMTNYGYTNVSANNAIEYRAVNTPMMRCVFQKNVQHTMFDSIRKQLSDIKPIGIDEQVVVYGLGDLAMHQIAQSGLNIAYFVDENPIYKGAKINGIPVKQKITTDHPVLVIGSRQKDEIIAKLKGHRVIAV